MTRLTTNEVLQDCADECGFDSVDSMLETATFDVCPGVCINCREVVDSVEPDARKNWCESCRRASVRSVLVLAGVM